MPLIYYIAWLIGVWAWMCCLGWCFFPSDENPTLGRMLDAMGERGQVLSEWEIEDGHDWKRR